MNEHNPEISAPAPEAGPKITSERAGACHTFTLQRPQVLNAFDDEMCRTLSSELPRIARNPDIYIVTVRSGSPKAFCAGGDVLALTGEAMRDLDQALVFLRNEYSLNWLLECFSKPTVSFINGICMGSGVGLSAYNTHRIAGENYKWAMPETRIGLFPDVGVAHVLAKLPWPVGLYLGLTGRAVGRADAQWLRLVTHCIHSDNFDAIHAKLANAETVDPLLDGLNEKQDAGPLQKDLSLVRDHFSASSLAGIFASLNKAANAGSDWAKSVLSDLQKCSPISLALTDRHIRAARALDIRETLIIDYRLSVRCLQNNDFHEGVRAALRDKDGKPKWNPALLNDVTPQMIDAYFAPLEHGLVLPSRPEMQAARV